MAIYYVRPDGNDINNGLGPAANLAWATISKAFSTLASGDTFYIAPGTYRQASTLSLSTTFSSQVNIFGDPLCLQFSGLTPGPITITTRASSDTGPSAYSGNLINVTSNNVYFKNIALEVVTAGYIHLNLNSTYNITVDKCYFYIARDSGTVTFLAHTFAEITSPPAYNITIKNCIFYNLGANAVLISNSSLGGGKNWDIGLTIENCIAPNVALILWNGSSANFSAGGITINNSILGTTGFYRLKGRIDVNNSIISYLNYGPTAGNATMRNSYIIVAGVENGFALVNSFNGVSVYGVSNFGQNKLWGLNQAEFYSALGTRGEQGGYVTGSTTDIYGNSWNNSIPDIGPVEGTANNSAISYIPIEKQYQTFNVKKNTTSRTENVYLGVRGLTYTSSGLNVSYVLPGSNRVSISLASQTPTGSWVSGGFCEIDSVNLPGMYRFDVPNIVFSNTNSSVVQFTGLSTSNGLILQYICSDSTADLLNTQAGIYTASGTLGARLLQTVADNRPVIVTSANQIQVDAGQTFSSGSGTTILDPILNSVGRWTLEGSTLTLYNADGTYLRRCNLTQLGLSLSPT